MCEYLLRQWQKIVQAGMSVYQRVSVKYMRVVLTQVIKLVSVNLVHLVYNLLDGWGIHFPETAMNLLRREVQSVTLGGLIGCISFSFLVL